MKRFGRVVILMTSLVLIISANVMGQDSTKSSMRTIFGGKNAKYKIHHLGIYFAPEVQYGQLDGSFTSMGGSSVMVQVNKKLGIGMTGFAGRGSRTDTTKNGGNFGGLKLEYTPKPDAPFHVSFPLMLGMGGTGSGYRSSGYRNNGRGNGGKHGDFDDDFYDHNTNTVRSVYAVVQPGIALEANLFRYAKVFAGANYRFAFNSAGTNSALQGFSTNAGLKIGIFDYSLAKKVKKDKKVKTERSEARGRGRRR